MSHRKHWWLEAARKERQKQHCRQLRKYLVNPSYQQRLNKRISATEGISKDCERLCKGRFGRFGLLSREIVENSD
jgi:hypothetical protein